MICPVGEREREIYENNMSPQADNDETGPKISKANITRSARADIAMKCRCFTASFPPLSQCTGNNTLKYG